MSEGDKPVPQEEINTGDSLIQIIDENGVWQEKLDDALRHWDFLDKGFDYWAISILGCQSSGKSTLLNRLFGTKFQVMESSLGRSQTTKGVWMAKSQAGSATTLVMDVEGTDGRERGEEQKSFERKSSLFSLALAEVLMINLWMQDVGRYEAAGYSLLKTVFELNLQLFASSNNKSKTLLLFIIRDHIKKVTPLERLITTLETDLNMIWKGLIKPPEFEDSTIRDFFDIEFTSLPHFVLETDAFEADVAALRRRFSDPSAPDFVFRDSYVKDVPADGWSMYAQRIWETIQESRDLDLPTQKEMLAMYRCDEIMEEAYKELVSAIEPLRLQLNKKGSFVPDFGQTLHNHMLQCYALYDEPASRYHAEVAKKKKQQLQEKAIEMFHSLFTLQLGKIREATIRFLDQRAKELIPDNEEEVVSEFSFVCRKLEEETLEYFNQNATDSVLPESGWSFENDLEEVMDVLKTKLTQLEQEQLTRLMRVAENRIKHKLMPKLNKLLDACPSDMWEQIAKLYESIKNQSLQVLVSDLEGYDISAEEKENRERELEERAFNVLKGRVKEKTEHMLYKMEKRFDEHFLQDEKGLPRRWTARDDIPKLFTEARQLAYEVLDLYSIIRLTKEAASISFVRDSEEDGEEPDDEENVDEKLVVLPRDECIMIKDRFKKESESAYLQALRDQANSQISLRPSTPMLVLLCILGFNEFVALVSNPLLFLMAIICGVIGYALWITGLADIPVGIAQEVASNVATTTKQWAVTSVVNSLTKSGSAASSSSKTKKD